MPHRRHPGWAETRSAALDCTAGLIGVSALTVTLIGRPDSNRPANPAPVAKGHVPRLVQR
jgi:hypothetical protein